MHTLLSKDISRGRIVAHCLFVRRVWFAGLCSDDPILHLENRHHRLFCLIELRISVALSSSLMFALGRCTWVWNLKSLSTLFIRRQIWTSKTMTCAVAMVQLGMHLPRRVKRRHRLLTSRRVAGKVVYQRRTKRVRFYSAKNATSNFQTPPHTATMQL